MNTVAGTSVMMTTAMSIVEEASTTVMIVTSIVEGVSVTTMTATSIAGDTKAMNTVAVDATRVMIATSTDATPTRIKP
ncbi:MAG: hypothetical protein D3908_04945 [Candidatus Electrothrix sp. AUS4]|nr:hypothetical protein [Candidatus Electrothrix sp. AUS4]